MNWTKEFRKNTTSNLVDSACNMEYSENQDTQSDN